MANPYENAARDRKVERLVDALDTHLGRRATRQDLSMLAESPVTASEVCRKAGVDKASQKTVDALIARIARRDVYYADPEEQVLREKMLADPFAKVAK